MFDLFRLPFDQYQRYKIVQEIVEIVRRKISIPGEQWRALTILDVGGYFLSVTGQEILPIRAFFPNDRAFALDVVSSTSNLEGYIQGNGLHLPFPDHTFDLVVSCDTLEHIPSSFREQFLSSLLRVARYGIILAAPFYAPNIATAEEIVLSFSKEKCGLDHPPLQEHRLYELPRLEQIETYLKQQGLSFEIFPTGYLSDWLIMMIARQYMLTLPNGPELNELLDRYYNLTYYNDGQIGSPNYRTILVIAKEEGTDWLDQVTETFHHRQTSSGPDNNIEKLTWTIQLLDKLSSAHERKMWEEKIQKLEARLQHRFQHRLQHQIELSVKVIRPIRRSWSRRFATRLKEQVKKIVQRNYSLTFQGQRVSPTPPLVKGVEFRQIFVAENENLSGVSILVATYNRLNTSYLNFKLYDDSDELKASAIINMFTLQDFGWCNFEFSSQLNSKGREYTLYISSPDGVIGDTVSLLISLDQEPVYPLYQNRDPLRGTLVYRLHYG